MAFSRRQHFSWRLRWKARLVNCWERVTRLKEQQVQTARRQSTLGFVWEKKKRPGQQGCGEGEAGGREAGSHRLRKDVTSSVEGQPQKVLSRNTWDPKTNANVQAELVLNVPFHSITTIKSEQLILKISSVYGDSRSAAGIIVLWCN